MNLTVTINVNFPKPLEVNVRLLTDAAAIQALTADVQKQTADLQKALDQVPIPAGSVASP